MDARSNPGDAKDYLCHLGTLLFLPPHRVYPATISLGIPRLYVNGVDLIEMRPPRVPRKEVDQGSSMCFDRGMAEPPLNHDRDLIHVCSTPRGEWGGREAETGSIMVNLPVPRETCEIRWTWMGLNPLEGRLLRGCSMRRFRGVCSNGELVNIPIHSVDLS